MSQHEQAEEVDPLIDEVRAVRKALSEQFDNDVEKLSEYLRRVGDEYRQARRAEEERATTVQR